ncbi:hypothetical protein [Pseudomonas mosselii]|uniref:hypothetical protein n=1 Tax=Pseudomonas mosselii TaxID=78327 RepID=UPI003EBACC61
MSPATRSPAPHALGLEHVGKACGQDLQLIEGIALAVAIAVFTDQGGFVAAAVAVAALDTGVEGLEIAMQRRGSGSGMVERTSGLGIIAHRQTPGFLLLECTSV